MIMNFLTVDLGSCYPETYWRKSFLLDRARHWSQVLQVALAIIAILFIGVISPLYSTSELVEALGERGFEVEAHQSICATTGEDGSDSQHAGICHLLMRIATYASLSLAPLFLWLPLRTSCRISWHAPLEFQPLERSVYTQAQPRAPPSPCSPRL